MVIGYDVQIKTSLQILTLQRETDKVSIDLIEIDQPYM